MFVQNEMENEQKLIKNFGFSPKENAIGIFEKQYADGYTIEVNFDKKTIYFGGTIKIQSKDFQNITRPEDWVVLECVNRLLENGYKPSTISLEKVYPAGHGFSGRLDICITREDGSEYLLIECKTYGKEFEKAFARMKKDGGQLFTYFKFSNKADVIMLYASELNNNEIIYRNEIVKIEDDYRIGDVKDFYGKWNKTTKQQGVWGNKPYDFKNQLFTKADLKELNEAESTKIFHEFASILRKHSVSDKPNAFNKIFNLFLAKLFDEAKRENDELEFHWRENDNAVDFQVRLINLHKDGLFAFLQKEIEGIDEKDFKANSAEELIEKKKKVLKFNNILAIKEVLDDASFDENQRVLKDVVKLLEKYQIRYPRKQQHLSDFFEKLLTTGLKQEVGQYFTPPPITKFIVRSLPIKQMIEKEVNKEVPELPAVIDYAAGSGHFITEAMEEYQDIINAFNENEMKNFFPKAIQQVKSWQVDPYEWAAKYVYGIEKDYRLVKVAKVGCYFYGDGVAQVIHGDGLDSFQTSKTYKGLLKENTNLEDSTKAKFSLVLSNPPYSVNNCKDDLEYIGAQNDFTLYPYLSDNSDDIECLFIERTKHLLKDDGIAAIVLPSTILNTKGIQSKAREIILFYFDVVAIVELGKSTFMATPTETVILFLKRRNNNLIYDWIKSIDIFFDALQDITINGIINPVSKFIEHIWDTISFSDYITLLKNSPNETIKKHELYIEYRQKIKYTNEKDFFEKLISLEKTKLLHFVITVKQKIVLVKTGKKEEEKRFLGYEFSSRRGSEGMHSVQKGKSIDDCTKLYNSNNIEDYSKASTYINKALKGDFNFDIDSSIQKNVFKHNLLDMLNFDRSEFENAISTNIKKKVNVNSKWDAVRIGSFVDLQNGFAFKSSDYVQKSNTLNFRQANIRLTGVLDLEHKKTYLPDNFRNKYKDYILENGDVVIAMTDMNNELNLLAVPTIFRNETDKVYLLNQRVGKFIKFDLEKINPIYLNTILKSLTTREQLKQLGFGSIQYNLSKEDLLNFKIPLPPINIQKKIVSEIELIETKEKKAKEEVEKGKETIVSLFNYAESKAYKTIRLSDENIFQVSIGKRVLKNEFVENGKIPVYSANVIEPFGNIDKLLIEDFSKPSVLWGIDGDWMVNHLPENYPFYPTDHCGFLRVKDNSVNEKYLAFILEKEGKDLEFSRTKRASIDRIQGIKIAVPQLEVQQKIVSEIEQIEIKIKLLEQEISEIPQQKELILKKYLQ